MRCALTSPGVMAMLWSRPHARSISIAFRVRGGLSETSGRYRRCGGAALKTAMTTYSFNYSVLDDPAAAGATVAFGINSLGQIVGYYLGGDAKNHGFLYS